MAKKDRHVSETPATARLAVAHEAHRALDVLGAHGARLRQLADHLLARDY